MRGGNFVARWEVLDDLVVILRGLSVVSAFELNFSQIEAGIPGEVGAGIKLHVVLKFLRRQIHLAGVVVAQAVVVEHIRRRSLLLLLNRLSSLGRLRGLRRQRLLRSLQVF